VVIASAAVLGAGTGITVAAAKLSAQELGTEHGTLLPGFGLLMIVALCACATILALGDWILALFGTAGPALDLAQLYLRVWVVGLVIGVPVFVLGALFRGAGRPGEALKLLLICSAVTCVVQPAAILGTPFTPGAGAVGGAIASALGYLGGLLYIMCARTSRTAVLLGVRTRVRVPFREIARTGLAASLAQSVDPVALAIVTAGAALISTEMVADMALLSRIERLVLIMPVAISLTIPRLYASAYQYGDDSRPLVSTAAFSAAAYIGIVGGMVVLAAFATAQFTSLGSQSIGWVIAAAIANLIPVAAIVVLLPHLYVQGRPRSALLVSVAQTFALTPAATALGVSFGDLSVVYLALASLNLIVLLWLWRQVLQSVDRA
jgi:Na+-driven multidrug efflux pump